MFQTHNEYKSKVGEIRGWPTWSILARLLGLTIKNHLSICNVKSLLEWYLPNQRESSGRGDSPKGSDLLVKPLVTCITNERLE